MIIYITINLVNGKKYIGKDTKNNPNYLGSGTLFKVDLKKFGNQNFKKEIIEYCTKENINEREIYWITFFNSVQSDDFYNLVELSGGWDFSKVGEEKYNFICNKISTSKKGIKNPKLSNNQERKDKLSKANKGKPKPAGFSEKISKIKQSQHIKFSDKIKENMSKIRLGKKRSQSFIDKKYKPIIQLDKEGNIIREFKSLEEACNSNEKFKQSNISCCLTGFSKTAYNFIWKYKN
jgi:hypothetical protein